MKKRIVCIFLIIVMAFNMMPINKIHALEGLSFEGNKLVLNKGISNRTLYIDENSNLWIWGGAYINSAELKKKITSNVKSFVMYEGNAVILYNDGSIDDLCPTDSGIQSESLTGLSNIVKVDIGRYTPQIEESYIVVALKENGEVFRWGYDPNEGNYFEDDSNETNQQQWRDVTLDIPEGFVAKDIAVGEGVILLVAEDGQLWSVGDNINVFSETYVYGAMEVSGYSNIEKIDMYDDYGLAINLFGEVKLIGNTSTYNDVKNIPDIIKDSTNDYFSAIIDVFAGSSVGFSIAKHSNNYLTIWGSIDENDIDTNYFDIIYSSYQDSKQDETQQDETQQDEWQQDETQQDDSQQDESQQDVQQGQEDGQDEQTSDYTGTYIIICPKTNIVVDEIAVGKDYAVLNVINDGESELISIREGNGNGETDFIFEDIAPVFQDVPIGVQTYSYGEDIDLNSYLWAFDDFDGEIREDILSECNGNSIENINELAVGTHTVTFKVTDSSNNTATQNITFIIEKAEGLVPIEPKIISKTETSIVLEEIEGQEFIIAHPDYPDYRDFGEFIGLSEGQRYLFNVRIKETDLHEASDALVMHISTLDVPPVFSGIPTSHRIEYKKTFKLSDLSVTAYDNVSGDVTDDIIMDSIRKEDGLYAGTDTSNLAVGNYTVILKVSDEAGNIATETFPLEIKLAGRNDIDIPKLSERTETSIKLVSLMTYEALYRINGGEWQDSEFFPGLIEGETYLFEQKLIETEQYEESKITSAYFSTSNVPPNFYSLPDSKSVTYGETLNILDLGLSAGDAVDGDRTSFITADILNSDLESVGVDTSVLPVGYYTIVYKVSDSKGNENTTSINLHITSEGFKPIAPTLENKTETTITLKTVPGMEYYMVGPYSTWQDDNVFTDLEEGETYQFIMRVKAVDGHPASNASDLVSIQTTNVAPFFDNIPNIGDIVYGTKVNLLGLGLTASDNVSGNLTDKIEYTIVESKFTDTEILPVGTYDVKYTVSDSSSNEQNITLSFNIIKADKEAPAPPTHYDYPKNEHYIFLNGIDNGEYKIEGGEWQDSPWFENLLENTTYTFYMRYKETDTHHASPYSTSEITTLNRAPRFTYVPNNKTIKHGENFDLMSLDPIAVDEKSPLDDINISDRITVNIADTSNLLVGDHTVIYTVVDQAGNVVTANIVLTVTLADTFMPDPPVAQTKTETSITLKPVENAEYRMGDNNWQDDNVFTNLIEGKSYGFEIRIKATDTHEQSPARLSYIKTLSTKPVFNNIPDNQIIDAETSINLLALGLSATDNGTTDLTDSITYHIINSDGLDVNNDTSKLVSDVYTVIYEVKDEVENSSKTQINLTVNKNNQDIPPIPVVTEKTEATIILEAVSLCEYRIDNGMWQSNRFYGLTEGQTYKVEQRYIKTPTQNASEPSSLMVTTKNTPPSFQGVTSKSYSYGSDVDFLSIGVKASDYINGTYYDLTDKITVDIENAKELLVGNHIVTYSVYDVAGNNATHILNVTITPLNQDEIEPPTVIRKTETTIEVEKTSGAEYSIDGINYQDNAVFSGLEEGKTYTIHTRKKATGTLLAGKSSSVEVSTKNLAPVFNNVPKDQIIYVNDNIDLLALGLTASDGVDGDITSSITVDIENTSSLDAGEYTINYLVKDAAKNSITVSMKLSVIKQEAVRPEALNVNSSYTKATSIRLNTYSNAEYKIEGGDWTTNPYFENLKENTNYTFYMRYKENRMCNASPSISVSVKTLPDPPEISNLPKNKTIKYGETLDLSNIGVTAWDSVDRDLTDDISIDITDYDKNPLNTNDTSNLDVGTYYVKFMITDSANTSDTKFMPLFVEKAGNNQVAPIPEVSSKTETEITLKKIDSMQYSMFKDGKWEFWTDDNYFADLNEGGTYYFKSRIIENNNMYASNGSDSLTVTTNSKPPYFENVPETQIIEYGDKLYLENLGLVAKDEIDGIISSKIKSYILDSLGNPILDSLGFNIDDTSELNVGEYKIKYTVSDKSGETASITVPLIVEKANSTTKPNNPTTIELTSTKIVLKVIDGLEYSLDGVSYSDEGVFDNLEEGAFYIIYTRKKATQNHNASLAIETRVTTKNVTPIIDKYSSEHFITYGQDYDLLVGVIASDNVDGDITDKIYVKISENHYEWRDFENTATLNAGRYYIKYSVSDNAGNYEKVESLLYVDKAMVAKPHAPIVEEITSTTITIKEIENAVYSINDSGWQESNVIETINDNMLQEGETYYIKLKIKETDNYLQSEASDSTTVSTLNIKPIIYLEDDAVYYLGTGDIYIEQGARAYDNVDGLIDVEVNNENVDTSVPGEYIVIYNATDAAGNKADEVTLTVIVTDDDAPVIKLIGDDIIYLSHGGTYIEKGAEVSDNVDDIELTIGGDEVNTSKLGTYVVTYNAEDKTGNKAKEVTRKVIVKDKTKPIIKLNGDSIIHLGTGDIYKELGAIVSDNWDRDLTPKFDENIVDTKIPNTYEISYNVTDNSGNKADEVIRTIIVTDDDIPVMTLKGEEIIHLGTGDEYVEQGVDIVDNVDIDLSAIIGGDTVDTNAPGTYILTYNVSDRAGNKAKEVTRTVIITDDDAPLITVNPNNLPITFSVNDNKPNWTKYFEINDNIDGYIQVTEDMITENVDMSVLSDSYIVTLMVEDNANNESTAKITISVIDDESPIINLNGDDEIYIAVGDNYKELGATVGDNFDEGLEVSITYPSENFGNPFNERGHYTVNYNATDKSGNKANQTRHIYVLEDKENPKIDLHEKETIIVEKGDAFNDSLISATDDVYKNLPVIVGGDIVDKSKTGKYIISYETADGLGKKSDTAYRTVYVTIDNKYLRIEGEENYYHKQDINGYIDPGAQVYNVLTNEIEESYNSQIIVSPSEVKSIGTTNQLEDALITYSVEINGKKSMIARNVRVIRKLELQLENDETEIYISEVELDKVIKSVKLIDTSLVNSQLPNPQANEYTVTYKVEELENTDENIVSRKRYDFTTYYTHKDGYVEEITTSEIINIKKNERIDLYVYDEEGNKFISDEIINIKQGKSFNDPGLRVTNKEGEDITDDVDIKVSDYSTNKLGKETIIYTVTGEDFESQKTRVINVIRDISIYPFEDAQYLETDSHAYLGVLPNYYLRDNYLYEYERYNHEYVVKQLPHPTVTILPGEDDLVKEIRKHSFEYEYDGEIYTLERNIKILYDYRFELNGRSIIEINVGDDYISQGASIRSNYNDQVIKEAKLAYSNVNPNIPGIYKEYYTDDTETTTLRRTVVVKDKMKIINSSMNGVIPFMKNGRMYFIPTNEEVKEKIENIEIDVPFSWGFVDASLSENGLSYIYDNLNGEYTIKDADNDMISEYDMEPIRICEDGVYGNYYEELLKVINFRDKQYLLTSDNRLIYYSESEKRFIEDTSVYENVFAGDSNKEVMLRINNYNKEYDSVGVKNYENWLKDKDNLTKVSIDETTDGMIILYGNGTAEIIGTSYDLSSYTNVTDVLAAKGSYLIINDGQIVYFGFNEDIERSYERFIAAGYDNNGFKGMAYTHGSNEDNGYVDILLLKEDGSMLMLGDDYAQEYIPKEYSAKSKMTLNGDGIVELVLNDTYVEEGATVYNARDDKYYNDDVIISGNVDVSKIGTYAITYSYQGQKLTRTIYVKDYISKYDVFSNNYFVGILTNSTLRFNKSNGYDLDVIEDVKDVRVKGGSLAILKNDGTINTYSDSYSSKKEEYFDSKNNSFYLGYFEKGDVQYSFFRDEENLSEVYIGNKLIEENNTNYVDFNEQKTPSNRGQSEVYREEIGIPKELLKNVKDFSSSSNHIVVLKKDGTVQAFGDVTNEIKNRFSYIPSDEKSLEKCIDKYSTKLSVPDNIPDNIKRVFARNNMSLALTDKGELFTWGESGETAYYKEEKDLLTQDERVLDLSYYIDGIANKTITTNRNPLLLVKNGHSDYIIKYSAGEKGVAYFKTGGKEITEKYQFHDLDYGMHTIYILDKERNAKLVHFKVREAE